MPFSLCGCLANEAYNTNRTSTSALSITRKPLIEFATNTSSICSRTSDWMRKTNGSSTISITSKRVPSKLPIGLTEWTEINRGVRQGCVMSPDFFNLYSEHILRRLEESNDGVTINGACINNIRYVDDTALIADSEEGLQRFLDLVLDAYSDEGLEINCKKTFCMVVSKERQPPTCNLICNGTGIEQVNYFNYLGSMLTSYGRCDKEIRRRIGMAKTSFNQMSPVLKDRKLSILLKVRLLKCFIWSVLLYGCESWTLSQQRWPGTSRPHKCGSIVGCSVSRIQHMKATSRCFNEWDKNASSSGPSKRDKHVLPATWYGKANSRISSSPIKSKERRQEVDKGFFSSIKWWKTPD